MMRYTARVGFVGYTPQEIRNLASAGRSVAVYNRLIYDLTTYLTSPLAIMMPTGTQATGGININFMDSSVLDLFKFNAGQDITKELNSLKIDSQVFEWQKTCL